MTCCYWAHAQRGDLACTYPEQQAPKQQQVAAAAGGQVLFECKVVVDVYDQQEDPACGATAQIGRAHV